MERNKDSRTTESTGSNPNWTPIAPCSERTLQSTTKFLLQTVYKNRGIRAQRCERVETFKSTLASHHEGCSSFPAPKDAATHSPLPASKLRATIEEIPGEEGERLYTNWMQAATTQAAERDLLDILQTGLEALKDSSKKKLLRFHRACTDRDSPQRRGRRVVGSKYKVPDTGVSVY